jgi:hypothetical protein
MMSGYLVLRDVRITGYLSQGVIALVATASVLATAGDWSTGETSRSLMVPVLFLPAAMMFGFWFNNAKLNAEAIALRDVRRWPDVWRASDPAQWSIPFEQRVPSVWIKRWQFAVRGMLAAYVVESFARDGTGYFVLAGLSAVLAVVAAALAAVVIAKTSALQKPGMWLRPSETSAVPAPAA